MSRFKFLVVVIVSAVSFLCVVCGTIKAQSSVVEEKKAEVAADKEAISAQKQEIKENAQAAKAEEKQLKDQISQAVASGDKAKAAELRAQLKTMHAANVQEKRQDKKELNAAKKELRKDLKKPPYRPRR